MVEWHGGLTWEGSQLERFFCIRSSVVDLYENTISTIFESSKFAYTALFAKRRSFQLGHHRKMHPLWALPSELSHLCVDGSGEVVSARAHPTDEID